MPSSRYHDDEPLRLPTLRDLIAPLFRYRRAAALVFLVVMAVAIVAAATASRTYVSEMKILVKRERIDPIVTSEAQPGATLPFQVTESEIYSQVELLTSRDLLEQVAIKTGMLQDPEDRATGASEPGGAPDPARLAGAVRRLRAGLTVAPAAKTTIISVRFRSEDPVQAARVLDALGALYLDKHLALHRPIGAQQFFTEQMQRVQADLAEADARLNAFTEREHVVSAAAERETTLRQLGEFETTLQQTMAAVADATQRLEAIDQELAGTPSRQVTQIRDGGNLDVIRNLRSQILQLEIKRSDLLQKFTPQYVLVVQAEAELRQLQTALAEAEAAPLRDETSDQNPTYQWLANERARVRTEREALVARAAAIRRTVGEYRQRAATLDAQSLEQQELIRARKAAEDSYVLYQRKQEEARVSDELDRTRIANVAIAEPASVPQIGSSPRRLILIGGLGIALLFGALVAYGLHLLNPHFRTPDEVFRVLDVPVLASLPAADSATTWSPR